MLLMKPNNPEQRTALTLIELLIAVSLMTVLMMSAFSFEFASQRFLRSSERKTVVLNEVTFVMEHMHKAISGAAGLPGTKGAYDYGIDIYDDSGARFLAFTAEPSPATPANFSDNTQELYVFNVNSTGLLVGGIPVSEHSVAYIHNNALTADVLTRRLADLPVITRTPNKSGIAVTLSGLYDPSLPEDASVNPRVTVNSTFYTYAISSDMTP